jgi:PAS domain S-box-containing protein
MGSAADRSEASSQTTLFTSLAEQSADSIVVVFDDGSIRYMNPMAGAVTGRDPGESRGLSIFELVHPDDVDRAIFDLGVHTEPGTPPGWSTYRVRSADGSWLPMQVTTAEVSDGSSRLLARSKNRSKSWAPLRTSASALAWRTPAVALATRFSSRRIERCTRPRQKEAARCDGQELITPLQVRLRDRTGSTMANDQMLGETPIPKVRVHNLAISLDGYATGPNQTIDNPLGVGGTRLHEWAFATSSGRQMRGMAGGDEGLDDQFVTQGDAGIGATIMGRNMFGPIRGPWGSDQWTGWWGDNPPYYHPVFVLTHHARPSFSMDGGLHGWRDHVPFRRRRYRGGARASVRRRRRI